MNWEVVRPRWRRFFLTTMKLVESVMAEYFVSQLLALLARWEGKRHSRVQLRLRSHELPEIDVAEGVLFWATLYTRQQSSPDRVSLCTRQPTAEIKR